MTDETLAALLRTLEVYGQSVPLDRTIRPVREGRDRKVRQEAVTP